MNSEQFMRMAKDLVRQYAIEHLDKADLQRDDRLAGFDVYIVSTHYILGHQKALVSTSLPDGMYYEITYNKDKNEAYFDAYKKFENKCIKVD